MSKLRDQFLILRDRVSVQDGDFSRTIERWANQLTADRVGLPVVFEHGVQWRKSKSGWQFMLVTSTAMVPLLSSPRSARRDFALWATEEHVYDAVLRTYERYSQGEDIDLTSAPTED